ncbi:GNAT family N-acetyltransferase [Dyadobacter arcticus]|uniref:Glyoxalase superfamily protein PhnB/GNAT superfamily N-acetyltransferase n=1 Tax=Dyadobacter arcticus TaxID=1078754 RepID=A0ABX0UP66_9BACT|nr:GNAT family N-acetyltransferase [Dyadobacter arcticus]NIJ54761.1 putative glyoxalase superfamily protein PhnB/GNAT superfamily N-acetyltransferase [Dyadobacter arcticus]
MIEPIFSHAEPMLQVGNVAETVKYWQETLGFPNQWTWGDPPTHGGVSWHGAFIQFSDNPESNGKSHGESIWMRVSHIQQLYAMHQEKGANVVMPLARQPYGFDEYMIKDLNGYYIAFAAPASGKESKSETLPDSVKILGRRPTPVEYRNLFAAVGWANPLSDDILQKQLDLMQYAVVAENAENGEAIGCALLFGDGFSFYYVKDVMVHPDWQGKRVGTAMMQEISRWLNENAPDKAMVGLFTGENLKPFYQQFNFGTAYGMVRTIYQPNP